MLLISHVYESNSNCQRKIPQFSIAQVYISLAVILPKTKKKNSLAVKRALQLTKKKKRRVLQIIRY